MKNKVVYILLDAFRSDYINEKSTPFLFNCSQKGIYYKEVVPSLSFCERTEIFTGQKPNESGFFTAIGYNPESSEFKKIRFLLVFFHYVEVSLFSWNKKVNYLFRSIFNKTLRLFGFKLSCYNIPLNLLRYFSLTEDAFSFFDEKAFDGRNNIFKYCSRNNIKVFYDSFTALNFHINLDDDGRLNKVLLNAGKNYDLYMIYISAADANGHKYGPDSDRIKYENSLLDSKLQNFFKDFCKVEPNTKLIVNGDHGMRTVSNVFNIKKTIETSFRNSNLKLKTDYLFFIDSTILRIWFFNQTAKDYIEDKLLTNIDLLSYGTYFDEKYANKFNIPYGDRRYGDFLWVANKGVLLFPDFFHKVEPQKGMHGYAPGSFNESGMCIEYHEDIKHKNVKNIELTEVYNILINSIKKIK